MRRTIPIAVLLAFACGDPPAPESQLHDTARNGQSTCPKCMQPIAVAGAFEFEYAGARYYLHPEGGDQWCREGFTQWPDSYSSGQPGEGCMCPVHMRGCGCPHCTGREGRLCPCLTPQ